MSTVSPTPHTPFSVTVVPEREEVHVVVAGGIDVTSANEVEDAARDLLDRGFDAVVIDLGAVEFIDSTGLRALLRLRDQAELDGCELVLTSPRKRFVLRIFDVTGTYGLFRWRERAR
jgi:anti-anti-sigma factor